MTLLHIIDATFSLVGWLVVIGSVAALLLAWVMIAMQPYAPADWDGKNRKGGVK